MMDKGMHIAPCRFCGSKAVRASFVRISDEHQWHHVECGNCFAVGPHRASSSDAIMAWNMTEGGFIVGNGSRDRWRAWEHGSPIWVEDRNRATRYHRRADAEAVHAEDEDAWAIVPYGNGHERECICPKCGLRHGGSNVKDAGF